MRHGEAVEADLLEHGVDLLDFYRGGMTVRRLWVLVEHWCLKRGTAVAYSLHGERGRWTASDEILAQVHGGKIPEDKVQVEWKQQQQARISAKRARIAAQRQAEANSAPA